MFRRVHVLVMSAVLSVVGFPSTLPAAAELDRPTRILIIVLDQMRPDYVERFDMEHVRSLMEGGVNFPNAILGHMAAETVITHNVLTSGVLPKHMGWSNEVYRDVGNVLGGGDGAYHVSSSFACGDFGTLASAGGYPKLEDHLGGTFVSIGPKTSAACPAGQPADADDIIIRMGSRSFDCDGDGFINWRGPAGVNVPSYVSQPECGRFYVDSSTTLGWGTLETPPAWMYPLDGNRFAVGTDPAHLGGDIWTADAAIAVMQNETDWRGMLVSLPSIDKQAHMWGTDDEGPSGVGTDVWDFAHLPKTAEIADQQVGRLLQALEDLSIRDDTLVVLTTDHAGQTARRFHGVNQPNRSNFNWYYGAETGSLADEAYLNPSPAIASLVAALGGNLDFSYQDGHIALWLDDTQTARLKDAAKALRRLPDVIAAYVRDGDVYRLHGGAGPKSGGEASWWARHGKELADTMAAPYGPDVVGLLRDDTSYGVLGDHGGHQRAIQRIPIAFNWPGLDPASPRTSIRSVDIMPTVLRAMGIAPLAPLDGRAVPLSGSG
jgi:hypothetical protein